MQRVRHANRGRLLLRTPGPVPLWDLHVFLCRDQSLLNLFCLRTLGTYLLLSFILMFLINVHLLSARLLTMNTNTVEPTFFLNQKHNKTMYIVHG